MSSILQKYREMNCNLQTAAREMSDCEYAQLFSELVQIRSCALEARALEYAEYISKLSVDERVSIAKKLLPYRHVDSIIAATGLIRAEVEKLRDAD